MIILSDGKGVKPLLGEDAARVSAQQDKTRSVAGHQLCAEYNSGKRWKMQVHGARFMVQSSSVQGASVRKMFWGPIL